MYDHPDYHRELEIWYNRVKALGQSIISEAEKGARWLGMGQLVSAAVSVVPQQPEDLLAQLDINLTSKSTAVCTKPSVYCKASYM